MLWGIGGRLEVIGFESNPLDPLTFATIVISRAITIIPITLPASIIRISRFCISAVVTVTAKSVCFSGTFRVPAESENGGDLPFLLTADSTISYSFPGFNPFRSNVGVLCSEEKRKIRRRDKDCARKRFRLFR